MTIQIPNVSTATVEVTDWDFDELILNDDYLEHRGKFSTSEMDDDAGYRKDFQYDYHVRIKKDSIYAVDCGYLNRSERYDVEIWYTKGERNIAYFETMEEAKELADKIWNWITSSKK